MRFVDVRLQASDRTLTSTIFRIEITYEIGMIGGRFYCERGEMFSFCIELKKSSVCAGICET